MYINITSENDKYHTVKYHEKYVTFENIIKVQRLGKKIPLGAVTHSFTHSLTHDNL